MNKIIISLFSAALFFACADPDLTGPDGGDTEFVFPEDAVHKGRMRIKLRQEPAGTVGVRSEGGSTVTGVRALDDKTEALGITRMERTFPHAGKFEERTRAEGLHLWYDVWFSENVASTRAASDVELIDDIEIAVPVVKVVSTAMPAGVSVVDYGGDLRAVLPFNDPYFAWQWGFFNPGTETWQQQGADIGVAEVWSQYSGHPDIIVSIVDGGIDLTHPDMQANLWINPGEVDGNGLDDDGNGYVDDVYGYNFVSDNGTILPHRHGTHVAGVIGATNNNGVGVSGIAGGNGTANSGVRLMNCQIFEHPAGNDVSDIVSSNTAAAIKYGADNGAVISQNSWGYAAAAARSGYVDPADRAAIDYFVKYAGCDNDGNQLAGSPMKGGIVLFASGNSNSDSERIAAPADYEKVLGVAAMAPDFKKASYSNYGTYIDISAPGGNNSGAAQIYSTTTLNRGYYEYRHGTSMACPHVAGVAALVIQKYGVGKPGFTVQQLEEILLKSATDLDEYNPTYAGKLGAGCVNAASALEVDLPDSNPFLLKSNAVTDGILAFRTNTDLAGDAVIEIVNGTGAMVMRKKVSTQRFVFVNVDVSGLAAGYYTLTYMCNDQSAKVKFVKY